MGSIWDKITFNSFKTTNTNNNNNVVKPSKIVNPPNQFFVRACKFGFPFLVLSNFALAGYVMTKAKHRDEVKAQQKNEAKTKKREGSNAKQGDEASAIEGHNANT